MKNLSKVVVVLLFLSISCMSYAQKNINNYKYVLVPKSFDFTKGEDQYQLSSITRFLFNKYGFKAYFTDEDLPTDLIANRCLALIADVKKAKGGFLKTKLEVSLKDCFETVVFTSEIGTSKLKEFKSAYNQAIREAMKTFETLGYKYSPKLVAQPPKPPKTPEVIEVFENEEEIEIVEIVEEMNENISNKLISLNYFEREHIIQLMNGNQVEYMLRKTTNNDVFILYNYKGILYKKGDIWVAEYYPINSKKLVVKQFKINF